MADRLSASLGDLLRRREELVVRERRLIERLNRVLPSVGYRVVPANGARAGRPSPEARMLACPECDRRFSRPLHLGRHLSATHKRRKPAKATRRATKAA